MGESDGGATRWQDELYDLLRRNDVTQFAYVPDAGHRILIDRSLADPGALSVALTTEEEGVASRAATRSPAPASCDEPERNSSQTTSAAAAVAAHCASCAVAGATPSCNSAASTVGIRCTISLLSAAN